jgi:signal peptidase I
MAENPETADPNETLRAEHARKTNAVRAQIVELTRFIFTVGLLAILIRSLVFAPFNIPSESMLPRLLVGDYLFVSKWPYGYSRFSFPFGLAPIDGRLFGRAPERGDIVVFKYPKDNSQDFIKRVIGLPGDLIQMRDGQLVLNGAPVPKTRIADFVTAHSPNTTCRGQIGARDFHWTAPDGSQWCRYPRYRETLPNGRSYDVIDQTTTVGDDTSVYVVPQGHYFMMGDNRDDSADSRFALAQDGVGFVPEDNLVGRAAVTFFSTDGSAEWLKPWTWFAAARFERIGQSF